MKVCVLLKQQWITVGPYLAVFYFHFDVYFVIMKVIFPQCIVVDEFHLQNLKIALTRKLSILEACCIEQKVFGCTCFTHI